MKPRLVKENREYSLHYHPDTRIVHHKLYKGISSQALREVLNEGIELLKQNRASKWLSDNHDIDPVSPEDTDWINSDWLPRAVAEGWKSWSLVVPEDIKARLNMQEFVEFFYNNGVRIMVFTDVDEAMTWLEQVE